VMDSGEHRSVEEETGENKHIRIFGADDMDELQHHKSARKQRYDPGPGRNGGMVRRRHRSIPLRGRPGVQEKGGTGKFGGSSAPAWRCCRGRCISSYSPRSCWSRPFRSVRRRLGPCGRRRLLLWRGWAT
jgi:hypothetical protein